MAETPRHELASRLCDLAAGLLLIRDAAIAERDRAGFENGFAGLAWALEAACRDLEEARFALDNLSGPPAEDSAP